MANQSTVTQQINSTIGLILYKEQHTALEM